VEQARVGIDELRDLAAGLHPGILSDRGLLAAVEALAGRLPVTVSVVHTLERRLEPPVEASLYFFVSEALTNVVKHAAAQHAWVEIGAEGDRLVVEVRDDGAGGATATAGGTGLSGLGDRIAALEGELTVTSPPGRGTRLHAEIPLSRRSSSRGRHHTRHRGAPGSTSDIERADEGVDFRKTIRSPGDAGNTSR
jgi:signal transduction histidine kinase